MPSRPDLRKNLRDKRRALTTTQQYRAATRLFLRLSRHHWLKSAQNIATYLAVDGEISPKQLNDWAIRTGKSIYLPCINPANKTMAFGRYTRFSLLKANTYGIYEPAGRDCEYKTANDLDVILMPLVGFDLSGNRIGMGGGYYDRALEDKNTQTKLIGLAHSQQQHPSIPTASWDVSVELIATEKKLIAPRMSTQHKGQAN